jgi:cell division inhibitor SepF
VSGLFTRFKDFVGINEPDPEEYEYEEDDEQGYDDNYQPEPAPIREDDRYSRRRRGISNSSQDAEMESNSRNNVIGMPGISTGVAEVVIIEPQSFDEMPQVIQTLRDRRSVVLNLNNMAPEEAQRAVDFVAGGTYAMDGHQERIGESIFLFTPSCVKVSTLSGIVHDVTDAHSNQNRKQAPNPNWGAESRYAAQ